MALGIVGRKCGMTRVFTEDGRSIPVTVVEALANRVAGLRHEHTHGYSAVQVAWGEQKAGRLNKPDSGLLAKAGVGASRGLCEFRAISDGDEKLTVGEVIGVDMFQAGQKVDVTGQTIGKGFAGAIKRHHFHMGDASHGNSLNHRTAGSIGQCQYPGRVFKGKKMAGHMGNVQRTMQNLEIIKVDAERNILLIKGAVPSARGGMVIVKPAVKAKQGIASNAA